MAQYGHATPKKEAFEPFEIERYNIYRCFKTRYNYKLKKYVQIPVYALWAWDARDGSAKGWRLHNTDVLTVNLHHKTCRISTGGYYTNLTAKHLRTRTGWDISAWVVRVEGYRIHIRDLIGKDIPWVDDKPLLTMRWVMDHVDNPPLTEDEYKFRYALHHVS
jgi:hypothetical protein